MTEPKAFLVAESEILDEEALASYIPPVRAALIAAGGRPAVISSIGGCGMDNALLSSSPSIWEIGVSAPCRFCIYR